MNPPPPLCAAGAGWTPGPGCACLINLIKRLAGVSGLADFAA